MNKRQFQRRRRKALALALLGVATCSSSWADSIVYPGYGLQTDPFSLSNKSLFPSSSFSDNSVTVNSADSGALSYVFGGVTSGSNSVERNFVTISGGSITSDVYGGYSFSGKAADNSLTISNVTNIGNVVYGGKSSTLAATNNTVNISTSTIQYDVVGGYSDTGTTSSNSVTIHDSRLRNVSGGYVNSGAGAATGNTVTITGNTTCGFVFGGYVISGTGAATGNTATLSSGSISNLVGGRSTSGTATGNGVIMTGGTVSSAVYGGYIDSGTGAATDNSVTISGGTLNSTVFGGYISSGTGAATGNSVTISGGTVHNSVYGGLGRSGSATNNSVDITGGTIDVSVGGGRSISGAATGNTVTMTDGSVGDSVVGGYVNSGAGAATGNTVIMSGGTVDNSVGGGYVNSGVGAATGNTVTLSGGTVHNTVYGGFSLSGAATNNSVDITGGSIDISVIGGRSNSGAATGNSLTISGGTLTASVFGGYVNSGTGAATGNTVTIKDGAQSSFAGLFGGGTISGTGDLRTGNSLNLVNYSGVTGFLNNFDHYNFTLRPDISAGDTVLTVTGIDKVDLTGAKVQVYGGSIGPDVAKASNLIGNAYILIDASGGGGITGRTEDLASTVCIPSLTTPGDYLTSSLVIANNQLLATPELSWNTLVPNTAHGSFTLDADQAFELDVVLADKSGTFTSGWNGRDLTKSGDGTLILSANNTYSGTTTISGGTLQVGNGGTSGTVAGNINNNGSLLFNRSDEITFSGTITGSGDLIQAGSGTLILSQQNTYSGKTRIAAGTVRTDAENAFASSSEVAVDSGTLALNGNNQIANHLTGGPGGEIQLDGATFTANNAIAGINDSLYAGTISGSGGFVKTGNGSLTLSGPLTYSGDTCVNAGSLILDGSNGGGQLNNNIIGTLGAAMSLINSATLTGWIDPLDVTIDDGSRWNMTASSTVNNLDLAGTIGFMQIGGFKDLVVQGDYTGNNGLIILNSRLDGDTVPSDRLVAQGNTAGSTRLQIVNAGGRGVDTVAKSIEVVQVDGNSTGTFSLSAPVLLDIYEYKLFKGDRDGNGGNWYLTSEVQAPTLNPRSVDIIRPEPAAYLGNQIAAQAMFDHSLHDRLGETGLLTIKENQVSPAIWTRVVATETDQQVWGGRSNLEQNTQLAQFGAEFARKEGAMGSLHLGVMTGFGQATSETDAQNNNRRAKGKVEGKSLGLYGTWYPETGPGSKPYLDSWIQYAWYLNTLQGDQLVQHSYESEGLSASLEAGWPLALQNTAASQVFLEPQAQIIYHNYSPDSYVEQNQFGDVRISELKGGGITTRVGARLYGRILGAGLRQWQPFLQANWLHQGTDNALNFGGEAITEDAPANRIEVKTGLQLGLSERLSIWTSVGYQAGSGDYRHKEILAGLEFRW
ncbi:MAG: autotransporter outer membrane beta-barrel domain-containing protein [Desulfocapsaceae bacterium]|nr:autotransporter outer membrane beta-barrel domain-containing protein [Desulfocapsaceae bacterium]